MFGPFGWSFDGICIPPGSGMTEMAPGGIALAVLTLADNTELLASAGFRKPSDMSRARRDAM